MITLLENQIKLIKKFIKSQEKLLKFNQQRITELMDESINSSCNDPDADLKECTQCINNIKSIGLLIEHLYNTVKDE